MTSLPLYDKGFKGIKAFTLIDERFDCAMDVVFRELPAFTRCYLRIPGLPVVRGRSYKAGDKADTAFYDALHKLFKLSQTSNPPHIMGVETTIETLRDLLEAYGEIEWREFLRKDFTIHQVI